MFEPISVDCYIRCVSELSIISKDKYPAQTDTLDDICPTCYMIFTFFVCVCCVFVLLSQADSIIDFGPALESSCPPCCLEFMSAEGTHTKFRFLLSRRKASTTMLYIRISIGLWATALGLLGTRA